MKFLTLSLTLGVTSLNLRANWYQNWMRRLCIPYNWYTNGTARKLLLNAACPKHWNTKTPEKCRIWEVRTRRNKKFPEMESTEVGNRVPTCEIWTPPSLKIPWNKLKNLFFSIRPVLRYATPGSHFEGPPPNCDVSRVNTKNVLETIFIKNPKYNNFWLEFFLDPLILEILKRNKIGEGFWTPRKLADGAGRRLC